MNPALAWMVVIVLGLILPFLGGMWFEQKRHSMTAEYEMTEQIRQLTEEGERRSKLIERQRSDLERLNEAIRGEQNRKILQSHGWRPLAGESLPNEGEQILVSGIDLGPASLAPNGYYYARFKRKNGLGQLTFTGGSRAVSLDGSVLWVPQRIMMPITMTSGPGS